jgi:ribosomal protein S8
MILNGATTSNVIIVSDDNEPKKQMNISQSSEVQAHIIKVLTDYSYKKKIESAIRETVSNSIDSHIEAGKRDEPVLVRLKYNSDKKQWWFESEDKGLGLDEEGFDKYIMGIGESTKRNNPDTLGMYGAGAKSPLSKVNSFYFICRKDGVERKFTLYKTATVPEKRKDYEVATDQPNGVIVHIDIPTSDSIYSWKSAMKEQLSYFPNIVYDVSGDRPEEWNNYKIFRHDDFEWSELCNKNVMHISLGGVYYPIDWGAMGKDSWYNIDVPIAVKLSLTDGVQPTFSREELQYDEKTIRIIEDKLLLIAMWFADRYNQTCIERENLLQAYDEIGKEEKYITLEGRLIEFSSLLEHTKVKVDEIKVKGISLKEPKFYKDHFSDLLYEYTPVAYLDENDNWKKKENKFASITKQIFDKREVVVLNETPVGRFKTYLRESYPCRTLFVVRNRKRKLGTSNNHHSYSSYRYILGLTIKNKSEWREYIKEWQYVRDTITAGFKDGTGLERGEDFQQWLEEEKKRQKEARQRGECSSNYKALNKQKGEITVNTARKHTYQDYAVFDKGTEMIESLYRTPKLTVYFKKDQLSENADFIYKAMTCLPNVRFVWLNDREIKHVENLKNFKTKSQFMFSKPLKRYITASLIKDYLNLVPDNEEMIYEAFPKYGEMKQKLRNYMNQHNESGSTALYTELKRVAIENNLLDEEIYPLLKEFRKIMDDFGFLSYLKDTTSWRTSEAEKKIVKNIIYTMLKAKKVSCKLVEDYELVEKPKFEVASDAEEISYDFYQPEMDDDGEIRGHRHEWVNDNEVWKSKEQLLSRYPNCTPVGFNEGDIEDPVFMDTEEEVA